MKGLKKISKNKKGFTLIELIIVIAILGILAFIVVPNFNGHKNNAKESADKANGKIISDAVAISITKDDIKEESSNYSDGKNDYTTDKIQLENSEVIKEQLSTIPTPEKAGTHFYVSIDKDGQISIYRGDDEQTTDKVYP